MIYGIEHFSADLQIDSAVGHQAVVAGAEFLVCQRVLRFTLGIVHSFGIFPVLCPDRHDGGLFSGERLTLREQEVEAAAKACEASSALMQGGSATYLEVLSAQAALLQSRLSRSADHLDLLQGQINFFKALGGK